MYLVLSIFLIFGGVVMALFPEFIYQLSESWKSDAVGTPSRWYIYSTRFGGIMCILAGLGGIVVQFI